MICKLITIPVIFSLQMTRQGSVITLQLDGGDGRRYNESFRFRGHQILSIDKQEGVYAGGPTELVGEKSKLVVTSFQGKFESSGS